MVESHGIDGSNELGLAYTAVPLHHRLLFEPVTKDAFPDFRINPLFKTDIVNVCWDTLTLDELLNLFQREPALAAGDQ